MKTVTRGFRFNEEAWITFMLWCSQRGMPPSTALANALEAYTGIHFPTRAPGRPADDRGHSEPGPTDATS